MWRGGRCPFRVRGSENSGALFVGSFEGNSTQDLGCKRGPNPA